jgi:hypothetical protein
VGATNEGSKSSAQFIEVHGFDDVIIGSGIEPFYALRNGVARREHQYRELFPSLARLPQHIQPVFERETQIENHGIMFTIFDFSLRRGTIAYPVNLKAGLPQTRAQAAAKQLVIFGKEDFHGA